MGRRTRSFSAPLIATVLVAIGGCGPSLHRVEQTIREVLAQPAPFRRLRDARQDSDRATRRAELASRLTYARARGASRAAALVALLENDTNLQVPTGDLPSAATLTALGVRAAAQNGTSLTHIDLKDDASRAAAKKLFREIIQWSDAAGRAAGENLTAPMGAHRLVPPPIDAVASGKYPVKRDFAAVERVRTGSTLDLAPVSWHEFFVIGDPADPRYTSVGRFYVGEDFDLVTRSGLSVLERPQSWKRDEARKLAEKYWLKKIEILNVMFSPGVSMEFHPKASDAASSPMGPLTVAAGTLRLFFIKDPSVLVPESRRGETVYRLPPGAAKPFPTRFLLRDVGQMVTPPLVMTGYLLLPRRDPAADTAVLEAAEGAREVALACLKAIREAEAARAAAAQKTAQAPKPAARSLTIVGNLPWATSFLASVKQPLQGGGERVVLDVSDAELSIRNLMGALAGLRLRRKVSLENIAAAETRKPALYRKRLVVLGENGALRIEEDPSKPRKRYLPEHPDRDKDGFVLFPNVYVEVEYNEAAATVREYNLLRLALMRLSPDHVIPELPLPEAPPPAISNGAEEKKE